MLTKTNVCLINLFQIHFNGRDATPQPLTQSDLIDIEEKYEEDDKKKRADSLWDALVEEVTKNKFLSSIASSVGPGFFHQIPDMEDITAEVKIT